MIYRFGPCELDSDTRELSRGGELLAVQPQVFELLVFLIENRARAAADRAILADTNEPWASMGRGMVYMVGCDSNAAIMNFGHAIDLSPNFAYAHAMLGAANAYAGNADLAITHIDTALRLSPRDTFIDKFHLYYALAHFQAERYLEAANAADRAIQLKPMHANTHMIAAASLALAGEQDRARIAEGLRLAGLEG